MLNVDQLALYFIELMAELFLAGSASASISISHQCEFNISRIL